MDRTQKAAPVVRNRLDRLIGWFAPRMGLRRLVARQAIRAYEGASRADGWSPKRPGASAQTDHSADARELRIRARALWQNVPYVAQAISVLVSARVGAGIIPVWKDETVARRWKEWGAHADYDGLLDINGLIAKAERTRDVDGEVLVRFHTRRMGAVVPLQLQVLEIDYLDTQEHRVLGNGHEIIAGIEYNSRGQRVAYWMFARHPGDQGVWTLGRTGQSQRVAASEVLHLFNPERPGQQAGFTRLAPVVGKIRDLHTYDDAELQRKQLEARSGVLATFDAADSPPPPLPEADGDTKKGPQVLDLGGLAGGGILGLPKGMTNPTFIEPKSPPGFVEYMRDGWKAVAAGLGVPYELMTGDMRDVNFSSARIRINQFRQQVEMEQWTITIPRLCSPIAQRWLQALELLQEVPRDIELPDWTTPKWASPNPVQDVAADMAAIKGGLQSVSETIRLRGYDPKTVHAELAQDLRQLQDSGVLPLLAALWGAQNPLELVASIGGKASEGGDK